jgi:hypothetical protein
VVKITLKTFLMQRQVTFHLIHKGPLFLCSYIHLSFLRIIELSIILTNY